MKVAASAACLLGPLPCHPAPGDRGVSSSQGTTDTFEKCLAPLFLGLGQQPSKGTSLWPQSLSSKVAAQALKLDGTHELHVLLHANVPVYIAPTLRTCTRTHVVVYEYVGM